MSGLIMLPATGERTLRFVGDQIEFKLQLENQAPLPAGWTAHLRTNLGRAHVLREEIVHGHTNHLNLTDASWRDIPMERKGDSWYITLPTVETGFFECKAYATDPDGRQHWPDGPNTGISVHPDEYRTGNTLYCAFPRMFGDVENPTEKQRWKPLVESLDKEGYTVIPPSGKLRDVIKELPHIVDTLGCRILHLLPVNSTPTTYARFGRYGSPYACQDLLDIDPALVEFDKRTTGVQQFQELTRATHQLGAKVFIDVVINHTGWGSTLQESHPEWFARTEDGSFKSPGAWGTVWEDLTELNHDNPNLWHLLSDVFLEWCRRGVDGFRCDAGYMIPLPAWKYITARVLENYPETIFFLEGLGGAWSATEDLLTKGAMQWAYSELFQNYNGEEVANYLDYSLKQSERVGLYVHYSETHDNDRLAKHGRDWSLLRNRLCALTSVSGAFGFTCGVEWLATEKVNVHSRMDMAWGNEANILPELKELNSLLRKHPCFFDGAKLKRISKDNAPVYALTRVSQENKDQTLVLVNTDLDAPHSVTLKAENFDGFGLPTVELLDQLPPQHETKGDEISFHLDPGSCYCLAASGDINGLAGDEYRNARAASAWALTQICHHGDITAPGAINWRDLADIARRDPFIFISALPHLDLSNREATLEENFSAAIKQSPFPQVIRWSQACANKVTMIPRDHSLLIEDSVPFRATLTQGKTIVHLSSVLLGDQHYVTVLRNEFEGDLQLTIEQPGENKELVQAPLRFLPALPHWNPTFQRSRDNGCVLLSNGLGGMARLQVDLGNIQSKYDCALGANLHSSVPVDRHILVKRVRAWVQADGFSCALDQHNLVDFTPGPPATWRFVVSAGNDRAVEIILTADMLQNKNTVVLKFERPNTPPPFGVELKPDRNVSLIVRCDVEDRSFHSETHRNADAEHHFTESSRTLESRIGFEFTPAENRTLRCTSTHGAYHYGPEWSDGVRHPIEGSRGQPDHGDAYSPGWFEIDIAKGEDTILTLCADKKDPPSNLVHEFSQNRTQLNNTAVKRADLPEEDKFGQQLALAVQPFVVKRGLGKTVIAGYPWFLDWGRDSLIAARGLLAAGLFEEVRDLLVVFGKFADRGTLPNAIHGEDASNRDTSDAPLWFGVVCEETAAHFGPELYDTPINNKGDTLKDALLEIATGCAEGTPNNIKMDPESGLIWSPSHFTWMDTNYPAGTPRQGYPVEIQALWIRLLRQLARLELAPGAAHWNELAQRAHNSFLDLFWMEDSGFLADLLIAEPGQPASEAVRDTALRSNCYFAISLGLIDGDKAKKTVQAGLQNLVIPGAMRSLAPLPVTPPLEIKSPDGHCINNPDNPYWGRYEGDEDTRRKPAYHNGTGWTWTLPTFCEALALAWENEPSAVAAARSYLASVDILLNAGSLGHLPEIIDGDAPHQQRGCDAQAWSATEALRVWKLLTRE